jgi:glycosyltransferase involved in cell wall biosynthesis
MIAWQKLEIPMETERLVNALFLGLENMTNPMFKAPKVSIILPTFNGSKYIRTSIESCLKQTFKDFELIIVDDASTDETPNIVKSYDDPRIKYIRNGQNQRLPGSLNIGFAHAKGDFLTWTSDDNFFLPKAIERMLKVLEAYRYDFVYADNFIFKDDDLKGAKRLVLDEYTQLSKSNCIRACFLYTRRVMNQVGGYDPDMELIEDYDFWVRVSKKFYMYHLKEALYYYRYHEEQLYTARNKEIKVIELLFQLKYGFMKEDLVEWRLRDLVLGATHSLYQKTTSFLFKKPQIKALLKKYKSGMMSFTTCRKLLGQVIYDLNIESKKTFIFFRRLPTPPEGEWGGLEELMFDWFERIDYKKCNVYVGVTKGWKERFSREAQKYNIPLTVIELPFGFDEGIIKRFLNMWKFLNNFKADSIIYFQAHFMEFSIAEILAGSLRSNGNVFMHENSGSLMPPEKSSKRHFGFIPGLGLWWQLNQSLINLRAHASKKVLVVSDEIKNRYVSWWKYPHTQVSVMYHGTDTKKFVPSSEDRQKLRRELNIHSSEIVIISTARFTKIKCLDRLLKAFDVLSKEFDHLRLLMVGSGPLEKELKGLAQTLNSSDRIMFLGHIDDPSVYLKASDIFVLSSDNEGLSLALLEAMAAGLICISTNCAGSNEAITDEKMGLIVEKSTEGVAQGLKKILSLPQEEKLEMSGRAAGFVREKFDINTNIEKVFKTIGLVN